MTVSYPQGMTSPPPPGIEYIGPPLVEELDTIDIDITQSAKGDYSRSIKLKLHLPLEGLVLEATADRARALIADALAVTDSLLVRAGVQDRLRKDQIDFECSIVTAPALALAPDMIADGEPG